MEADRRYEIRLIIVLGLTFGFVFFDRNSLNYLLPFILRDIPLSNTEIGLAAAVLALAWSVSGYLVGWISDRTGRRKPLLVGAVIAFSVASLLTGLASAFWQIVLARVIMGLADGPVLPLSQTLMAQASDPARRGLNMGLMQNVLSNLLGSLVAPLVMVWLASHLGWRFAFYLTVIPGLLLAAAIAVFVHEPEQFAPKPAVAPSAPATDLLRNRNIVLCIAISGLMVGWMIVGWVFLPVYLTTVAGFTPQAMSVVMAVLGISGAVAGFGVPGLSDRIGRRPAMIGFCLIGALSPLAALYLSGNLMLLCLVLATGWIAGGTFSLFMATIPAESIEPTKVATAMAVIMGAGELLGGAGAPLVVGWFSDIHGLKSPLFAEIIFATTAALLSFCLKETAPRKAGLIDGGEGLPFTTRQRG